MRQVLDSVWLPFPGFSRVMCCPHCSACVLVKYGTDYTDAFWKQLENVCTLRTYECLFIFSPRL